MAETRAPEADAPAMLDAATRAAMRRLGAEVRARPVLCGALALAAAFVERKRESPRPLSRDDVASLLDRAAEIAREP